MNGKILAIILLSSIAYLHGSDETWEPDTFPQPENCPGDVIKSFKSRGQNVKLIFNDTDISNETKSFRELGVRSYQDLIYRISAPKTTKTATQNSSIAYSADIPPSMPAKDSLLNAYPTLNGYGSCFEPDDSMSKQFSDDIHEHRKNNKSTNILEIGVGYGLLAKSILEKQVEHNLCCYTGIDLDKNHLNIATEEINKSIPNPIWNPIAADFPETFNAQHISDCFTHIGAFCVLHFSTPDKLQKTLCEIERLLAKGGKVFISSLAAGKSMLNPFISDYYNEQKRRSAELPGYIEDFPKFIKEEVLASDNLPEKTRQLILTQIKNAGTKQPKHHLLLTVDDLSAQVTKHTNLKINWAGPFSRTMNDTQVHYIGMILEKSNRA
jgi:SAM-dependent methyltransferase